MDKTLLRDSAKDQLNRLLTFFPRIETKASLLLAIDTGMLAILVSNAWVSIYREWLVVFPGLVLALVGASIWCLYHSAFPRLHGGESSLLYFREIARRTENNFIKEFTDQSEEDYVRDLLGQVWRNSEILRQKFDYLKYAFILSALAIVPWVISLTIFAVRNPQAQSLIR